MEILLDNINHPISFLLSINATKAVIYSDLKKERNIN